MKLSKLFFRTFKEVPCEAEITSHRLLEQAGYIRRLGKGLFIYTPLMWRVLQKVSHIIREEMNEAGAQEVSLPLLHPKELWQSSGRWDDFTADHLLYTVNDRERHEYCLAPTHEEVITFLVSNWITSYKQLPLNLYQIGTKFRDEIRPRFGLMRGKEFLMKDGYSFSDSSVMMEQQYQTMREAYSKIFKRLGLDFVIVAAHGGKIGQGKSEEFQARADAGEDVVMICQNYSVNLEAAESIPPYFPYEKPLKKMEKISTPGVITIEELSKQTQVVPQLILKTILYKLIYADKEEFVAIGIRGDRAINELKVATHFSSIEVVLATDEETKTLTGSSFGFVGPLDLKLRFYADRTCKPMTNFMAACNEIDVHMINVNWERDCPRPEFGDFLLAEEGDACPQVPGGTYKTQRGIEVGHIFNIGTKYSDALSANFQTQEGKQRCFYMGTYGIGVGRTAAACVEQRHDEKGIIWPLAIAPYKLFITPVTIKDEIQVAGAEKIYELLKHFEPLLDDRDERLGFKLKDSDLLGVPFKLIVGKTFVNEEKVEIESRAGEKMLVSFTDLVRWASTHIPLQELGFDNAKVSELEAFKRLNI
ncbi:MAG: proline--tRNA ligase [Chlamydiia bacterium]|nr:proline--tRNA ligase [Chlamydiia bacterium]